MSLYNFIQRQLMGNFVHYFVLCFIVISIIAIICSSFEAMASYKYILFGITYLSSFIFLIEYILRLIAAPAEYPNKSANRARWKYLFSFYGFVDFVAILPFILIYLYWDTNVAHIIILPYIFIIFKLIRYSRSFRFIGQVLKAVKDELVTAYTACGIMVCFSAILMYYIERNAQPEAFGNIGDGLWWAIVAFTTVGYGDIYPITPLGKILSSAISMVGIAMIAIPTGIISSSFINLMQKKEKK
ncbi:ion transporter [Bacteroides sp.]|uniref:ion transporter n=1 Tax=Bacteroides sp. TaxID=29523 RepID=UPI0026269E45|nr:ion transporter [Bacteroides sp.]MDD3039171.1 ion transporter [Bacteroides sp.]